MVKYNMVTKVCFQDITTKMKINYTKAEQVCPCKWEKVFNCQGQKPCFLAVIYMMQKHNIWPFLI